MSDYPKLPINRTLIQGNLEWALTLILSQQREASITIPGADMGPGVEGIAAVYVERVRQVWHEGWTVPHDMVHHAGGDLSLAAASLIVEAYNRREDRVPVQLTQYAGTSPAASMAQASVIGQMVPDPNSKPASRLLVMAGAMLIAELDRMLEAGECFACDRCGQIYDGDSLAVIVPFTGEVAEGETPPGQLRYGETHICQTDYAVQLDQEAREAQASAANAGTTEVSHV